jgi:hypothetical protein
VRRRHWTIADCEIRRGRGSQDEHDVFADDSERVGTTFRRASAIRDLNGKVAIAAVSAERLRPIQTAGAASGNCAAAANERNR